MKIPTKLYCFTLCVLGEGLIYLSCILLSWVPSSLAFSGESYSRFNRLCLWISDKTFDLGMRVTDERLRILGEDGA